MSFMQALQSFKKTLKKLNTFILVSHNLVQFVGYFFKNIPVKKVRIFNSRNF